MYPNERVEKRVEPGERDDARTDESTLFSVGRRWIFGKSLLDLGYGYPALGSSSGDSTQGTAEVRLACRNDGSLNERLAILGSGRAMDWRTKLALPVLAHFRLR